MNSAALTASVRIVSRGTPISSATSPNIIAAIGAVATAIMRKAALTMENSRN